MTDHIFMQVIFNENFLSAMKTSEPMQMLLNIYTELHVCICLYVCSRGGCVSDLREEHYTCTDCSQNSLNWEAFSANIVVHNDNRRSSQILSIENWFYFFCDDLYN